MYLEELENSERAQYGKLCLYQSDDDRVPAGRYLSPRPEGDATTQKQRPYNFCKNIRDILKRKIEEEKQLQEARKK